MRSPAPIGRRAKDAAAKDGRPDDMLNGRGGAQRSATPRPRTRGGLNARAYDLIKQDIVLCGLAPGEAISEARLAQRYGMGKAPIRNALARLTQEELVSVEQRRRGYVIKSVTLQDVHDLFEVWTLLEPPAAKLATGRINSENLRKLAEMCNRDYNPGSRSSATDFLASNKLFHLLIVRSSGNRKLCSILEQVLDETERLFHFGLRVQNRAHQMRDERKALVDALTSGDGDQVAAVARAQIETSRQMIVDAILSSSSLRSATISMP